MRYLAEIMRLPRTYIVAVIVGTLINLYGQILVPYLRGVDEPAQAFLREARLNPGVMTLSIALAYLFPLVVNVTSAMLMRLSLKGMESRALLMDQTPYPAFRADAEGRFVVIGAKTQMTFNRRSLRSAQEVLGQDLWRAVRAGDTARQGCCQYLSSLDGWYVLSSTEVSNGLVNVYLAETQPPS